LGGQIFTTWPPKKKKTHQIQSQLHTKGYFVKIMSQSRQISRTKLSEIAIFRQLAVVGSQKYRRILQKKNLLSSLTWMMRLHHKTQKKNPQKKKNLLLKQVVALFG
jgi:hypothetical protein